MLVLGQGETVCTSSVDVPFMKLQMDRIIGGGGGGGFLQENSERYIMSFIFERCESFTEVEC